jgi:hypothetical protein
MALRAAGVATTSPKRNKGFIKTPDIKKPARGWLGLVKSG